MTRGVRRSLVSSAILVALIALAGCSHYLLAEREPWRRDAEAACLSSGAVKETPARVRISAIDGPGACGISYPLRVSALGQSGPLSYIDEPPLAPPAAIPDASLPQHWPIAPSAPAAPAPPIESTTLPPLKSAQSPYAPPPQTYSPPPPQTYSPPPYGQAQYPQPQYGGPQPGAPMSLTPSGYPQPPESNAALPSNEPPPYGGEPLPPLGPRQAPTVIASTGPVELKPAATLACPLVSALDQWINSAVQPAALHWFGKPVVEIKQISAYSCRGMNGDPNAHISEHAFGNALDVAEFTLADGHKISVQYGWHGTPEEQGFLHDVQLAACDDFTTVLAPGANVYHYNHIHVDLMRHASERHICEPTAVPGEVAAARARSQYAARHGEPGVTGSIGAKGRRYSGEDDDSRPEAVPGDD